jgi:phosphate transport system substrate-binding protein
LLRDGLAQFPLVMGAIVPVVNLDGVAPGRLRLPGAVLAAVYLGQITRWRDPAIAAANPGLALPDRPILVVHRTDGSGTTYNWTDYLSHVSPDWSARVGASTKVAWPAGVGAKGGDGMIGVVSRMKGAIGYVEFSAATRAHLAYALPQNLAGQFVAPDPESFQATTASVDWARAPDFAVLLTDAQGPNAYPLMATSFALIRRYPKDKDHRTSMLAFFRWALEHGQNAASGLDYLPLPETLTRAVEASWAANAD